MAPQRIRIALDWTPNTIHTGLYVAAASQFYARAGLDVQLLTPDADYSKTPAKRLEAGEVDLAICPSESCIAYQESNKPGMRLEAIYAILQRDASAIVTTHSQITTPKHLAGKKYGSYNARYEDAIVRSIIDTDGGDGRTLNIESATGKFSLFDELNAGNIDATWIFLPWEGVEAEASGKKLNKFVTGDYDVPYGYSPVIARNAASSSLEPDIMKLFVEATRQGYEFALQNPTQAVEMLIAHCSPPRDLGFLTKSQVLINDYYSDGSELGKMKLEKWQEWLEWLHQRDLVKAEKIDAGDLFCNI